MGKFQKIAFAFFFGILFFVFAPSSTFAAACPVTDGGAGDGDGSANGTIQISASTTWTPADATTWDCSGKTVWVTNNSTLTFASSTTLGYYGWLTADALTIDSGSTISANSKGCTGVSTVNSPGYGPNSSNICTVSTAGGGTGGGGGGGHGGVGGTSQSGGFVGGTTFGAISAPLLFGSSGGTGGTGGRNGGTGGGIIRLDISGTFTHNGSLTAVGGGGTGGTSFTGGGGGSGGAIYVTTSVLGGSTGSFSVAGGTGAVMSPGTGGGGAGGRVAVVCTTCNYVLGSSAFTLTGGGSGGQLGGTGSAYVQDATSDTGTIYGTFSLHDETYSFPVTLTFATTSTQTCRSDAVNPVVSADSMTLGGTFTCTPTGLASLTFTSTLGGISMASGTTINANVASAALNMNLAAASSSTWTGVTITGGAKGVFTIDDAASITTTGTSAITANISWTNLVDLNLGSGTTVSATSKGCVASSSSAVNGYGPNGSNVCTLSTAGYGIGGSAGGAGGGGHGGAGARGGGASGAAGGTTYGSLAAPVLYGSSGGSGLQANHDGGAGGGVIRILVNGTFTHNAVITASGGAGTGGLAGSTGGGGGSGGSIYISAVTFTGTAGSFAASGGAGATHATVNVGGGGGGGKVSVRYVTDSSSFLSSRTAAGVAAGAGSASVGTLYTGSFYDAAGPAMTGAVTADSENDGQIDQVVVTFDTDVSAGTVAGADFSVAGYTVSSASRTASATVTIVLTESGAADTNATPTVTIVGVIEDASANVTSSGTQASTDGAAPVRLSQSYKDTDTNGTVDRFDIVYSETLTLDECDSADYTFSGADLGSIVLSSCAVSGTDLRLTVTGAASNDTLLTLTVAYTASAGTANSIHDAANNNAATYTAQTLADAAAPFALSASYLDTGATPDGTVNRVDIVFTEAMTISYTAGDWAFTTPGSLNLTDGGGSASTATINLIVTGDANETSSTSTPVLQYTNTASRLKDAANNAVPTFSVNVSDASAPLIASMTIEETGTPDGFIDKITMLWTENVDTDDGAAPVLADFGTITLPDGQPVSSATISDPAGASASVVLTNIVGQVTVNTASTGIGVGGITTQWTDGINVTSNPDDSETKVDAAAPVALSASYKDVTSVDGTVDRVDIIFSESLSGFTYNVSDWSFPVAGDMNLAPSSATVSTSTLRLAVTADALETGSAVTPTVLYTNNGNRVKDSSSVATPTFSAALSITDAVIASLITTGVNRPTYLDNDVNGRVDRLRLNFTENVTISYIDADWTATANGLTSFDTGAYLSGSGTTQILLTATAAVNLTGVSGGTEPRIAFSGVSGYIRDVGSNAVTFSATSIVDGAAAIPTYLGYRDANGDAQVDRIDVTFTEQPVVGDCAPTDYTVGGGDAGSIVVATAGCAVSGSDLQLTVTGAPASTTALTITLTYDAANGTANSLKDATTVAIASFGPTDIADGTDPARVSQRYLDVVVVDGIVDRLDITFSEPVTVDECEAGDFAIADVDAGLLVVSSCSVSGNDVRLTLTGGTIDTSLTLTLAYTQAAGVANSLHDATGNNVTNLAATALTDAAAPILVSQSYKDIVSVNGTVDRVDLTFSENITLDECDVADYTFDGASLGSIALGSCATSTTDLRLTITGAAANTTNLTLTVAYNAAGGTGNSINDGTNNTGNISAATLADAAAPIAISASYKDVVSINGTVDRVDILFSEAMTLSSYSAGDWSFPGTGSLNISDSSATASSSTIQVSVSSDTGETSSTSTPTVLYTNTANRLKDASNNFVATFGSNLNVTDAAAPAIRSVAFEDTGTANGLIDKLTILWSEILDTDDGAAPVIGDFGTITLPDGQTVSSATISDPAGASATVILTSVVGQVTPNTAAGSMGIDGITTHWTDGTNVTSNPDDAETITDSAAPFLRTDGTNAVRYEDSNGDATIDRVRLVFSEATTISYTDSDWTATANSLTSFDVSTVASGNGTATIYLTGSAASNITGVGAGTQPTIAFTAGTGSIVDTSTNALTSISSRSLADAAAPLLLSNTPASGATGVSTVADVVLTFSEAINTGTASVSFSATPSDLSSAWSVSDSVLTLSHTDPFAGAALITITVNVAADATGNAFGGADTGVTHPFSFTVSADGAAPVLQSGVTADADTDGHIDRVVLTFNEDVSGATVTGVDFTVTGYTVSSASRTSSATVTIVLTELVSYDTSAVPSTSLVGSVDDLSANSATSGTITPTDGATPISISASYKDTDVNGTVDRVDILFSEAMTLTTYSAGDWSFPGTGSLNISDSSAAASSTTIQVSVSSDAGETSSTSTPTVLYTNVGNRLKDAANNAVATFGAAMNVTDAAAPAIRTVTIEDTATTDGLIDKLTILWSEVLDTDDGSAPVIGDFGTITLPDGQTVSSATISDPAGASASVVLTSVVGQVTPNTAAGSTGIDGITTHWTDGTNVTSNPDDAETITDSAAPFLRTDGTNAVRYEDSNGDATIDRVKLVFSEATTISYTDSDWTATANGLTSFDVSTVGSGNGTATIYLTGSAASNLTGVGAGTQPTIAFTAGTGSIVDGSTNALSSISSRSLADAAAPLLLSSTPTSGATDVAVDASVILNFSEPIVTGTAAYTFSSAPTGLSDAWSVSDTRLTVSHSGSYTTGATITFTMTVAADASGNAFGGGDSGVTHPVVFTVISITNPTLVSATTADNDADGYLDRILVVFSEDITSGSVAGGDFTVTGYTVSSASRSASATVTIVFAEGGTADTSATPEVTVVGSVSGADDGTITSGSITPSDAVAPVLMSQSYKDVVVVNGVVDRFDLVFSEPITLDECDLGDYTIGGADFGSIAVASCSVSTTTLQLTVSNAPSNDTNLALTIAYTAASGTANSIHDAVPNNTGNISAATLADAAAPVAISASYKDVVGDTPNGTVDRVDILFSEAMTLTTYSAGDWSFPGTGSLNLSDSSAAASSTTIQVSVSSDAGETSSTSTPTILYTNAANRLTDAASNAAATFGAAMNVTDAAAPAIRSMTFEDTGTANGLIDKLTILWSEVLDTDDGSAPVIGDFGTITLPDGQTVSSATISDPAGASATVILTSVVGQVTPNTATGSTGINGITTYWTDGTNTTSNPDDAETITDSAAPVALSGLYQDIVSADGQVDKIVITFSEATTVAGCEVGDYSFGGSNGTGVEILNCTGTGTTTLSFELTGTPTANTAPSLTWNYSASAGVASSLRDATNAVANVSSLALADDADPRLITTLANGPRYQDADTNGTVDRVRLIFTEAVTFIYADADFSATPNSLTSFDVSGITSGNGSSTVYLTATALANLTGVGSATEPTLAFTPTTGSILDASSNAFAAFTATTVRDGAAPIARYATARDIDANGTADRIDITMTETAALDECEAGDYAWSGTDGGSVAVTACAASGNDMRLTISGAPSNDTLFSASMTYTQSAGIAASLDDGASNAVSDFTFSSFTDAIAPIIVTISPADGATSVTNTQNIIVTFSEPMNTGVYAHTLSPSVSSQVSTWNDAHTQVTTTHATFITGAYTFTVTSAEDTSANAFAGASAVTHPVTFTVTTRKPSTIITPVVPVPNIDSFTVTDASSIALQYLVPGSSIRFAWTYTGGDAWFALDVSYDAGKTSTRIIEPAATFNARTAAWTVPRSVTSATFTLTAMYNETKLTSKTSSRYTTAEIAAEEAAAEENTTDSASTAPESVIRVEGSDAVYAIVNGTRRVFINSAAYHTWYENFDDVVTVSAETLAEYPIAGLMLPKVETVLVKIQSVPYVYFLGSNADNAFSPLLRWITSEDIAISLFGTRWSDYVIDIAPTFFTKFTQGDEIDSIDDVEGDASTMVTRESLAAR